MKQITEDYVSFETAKLLKEKRFDWPQSPFYSEQDMDEWRQENSYQIPNPDYDPNIPFDTETITIVAPHISQSLALKWLREVHTICIEVCRNINTFYYSYRVIQGASFVKLLDWSDSYDTYEEAVEAALLYVLKNLI